MLKTITHKFCFILNDSFEQQLFPTCKCMYSFFNCSGYGGRWCLKRPWSQDEVEAVMRHMRPLIENAVTATSEECLQTKQKEPALESRSVQNIRDFVRNRGLAFKNQK